MGMLTKVQKKEMAVAHFKRFEAVCDEPNCQKLVTLGGLYVVLKWKKKVEVTPGLPDRFYQVPDKIRCMDCQARKEGREPGELKKQPTVKGKKKSITVEEAEKLQVNPVLKKAILRQVKKRVDAPPSVEVLYAYLKKKKAFRELKHKEYTQAVRKLRKLFLVRLKKKLLYLRK